MCCTIHFFKNSFLLKIHFFLNKFNDGLRNLENLENFI